jgi:NAD(P)H-hydrate epimerase
MMEFSKKKTAVVIGGGLGRNKETLSAVRLFLKKTELPCVIDADALYALNKNIVKKSFLLTPHAGEFYALTGKKVTINLKERIRTVEKEALRLKTTILLKGHIDIISDGKKTALNRTGNPYLTKGGTGDTLAGIAGSLIAQGNGIFDSACGAAYINGKAGDLVAAQKKQALLASDVLEKIADVIR